ncbi:phosphoethanolamine transferase [Flavobacteriaceae bacterium LMO-SS05]
MINYKGIRRLLYIFLVPIVLAFAFEVLTIDIHISRFYNFLENIFFAIILAITSLLFNNYKKKFYFLLVSLLLNNVFLVFETLYYYLFKGTLNASVFFVIFETNFNETNEFLSLHLDRNILIFVLMICVITAYSLIKLKAIMSVNSIIIKNKLIIVGMVVLISSFLKFSKLIIFNVPYLLVKTPVSYIQEMNKYKIYGKEHKMGEFTNIEHNNLSKGKELYVIVVGESTNKKHFNLYHNYYRETTPQLNTIKDDLYVFDNVISPHTYSIGSLTKVLTLGNYENKDKIYGGSIIQLFNQANFKTYWISNQRPVGMMDTQITKIGMGASKSVFLNTNHAKETTAFDIDLVNSLSQIFEEDGDKKVIFLHMLGTHLNYKNRYPKNEAYFKDIPITNFKNKKAYEIINSYDNAIRYNDKLLKNIIDITEQQNAISYVLYFSDHGQEVFDEIDFAGHTIDEQITRNMYEIPMFLWLSKKYKAISPRDFNLSTKYMTDDLFHSIADISNIKSNETDFTRSIFNKNFKERKRIIKDTINYDTYFKK